MFYIFSLDIIGPWRDRKHEKIKHVCPQKVQVSVSLHVHFLIGTRVLFLNTVLWTHEVRAIEFLKRFRSRFSHLSFFTFTSSGKVFSSFIANYLIAGSIPGGGGAKTTIEILGVHSALSLFSPCTFIIALLPSSVSPVNSISFILVLPFTNFNLSTTFYLKSASLNCIRSAFIVISNVI